MKLLEREALNAAGFELRTTENHQTLQTLKTFQTLQTLETLQTNTTVTVTLP
jgi:hypothetical protein